MSVLLIRRPCPPLYEISVGDYLDVRERSQKENIVIPNKVSMKIPTWPINTFVLYAPFDQVASERAMEVWDAAA